MRLIVGAGGTGGGVYPALAVLQTLNRKHHDILWIGSEGGLEADLVQRAGFTYQSIPAAGVHGVGIKALPGNLFHLVKGVLAARKILKQFKPEALFFTGGYVSLPVAFVGKNIPSLLFMPDIEPGLAIKFISRSVTKIAVTVAKSAEFFKNKSKIVVTGYPTRTELTQWNREKAFQRLALSKDKQTILVFGGSQGAQTINRALARCLPDLISRFQVLHISGQRNWEEVQAVQKQLSEQFAGQYHPYPYLHSDELGAAFAAADLVISRSGAAVLGEFPQFELPAILVPYPYAWKYQQVNAEYLEKRGAAVVIQDEQMDALLSKTILDLFDHPDQLLGMKDAMKSLAVPDAASSIARLLVKIGEGSELESEGVLI